MQQLAILSKKRERFLKSVSKLNKKAGFDYFQIEFSHQTQEELVVGADEFGEPLYSVFDIDVFNILNDNVIWKLGDYNVVCYYEMCDGIQKVTELNGEGIPEDYLEVEPTLCEHCHIKHNRTKQWLLEQDGNYFVVGSTCIKDYTGHDIQLLSELMNIVYSDDNIEFTPAMGVYHRTVKSILIVSSWLVEHYGYTSRKEAEDFRIAATVDQVKGIIYELNGWSNIVKNQAIDVDAYREKADWYIEKVKYYLDKNGISSGYEQSLSNILEAGYCPDKLMGLCISIVAYVDRCIKKENEVVNQGFLELDERYCTANKKKGYPPIDVTITYKTVTVGNWGTNAKFTGHTADNFVIKFSLPVDSKYMDKVEVGKTITIQGRVKGVNNDTKYPHTFLNRVSVI